MYEQKCKDCGIVLKNFPDNTMNIPNKLCRDCFGYGHAYANDEYMKTPLVTRTPPPVEEAELIECEDIMS